MGLAGLVVLIGKLNTTIAFFGGLDGRAG